MAAIPLDFSIGISWQFGVLAVASMLLFPYFKGRYAFLAGAIAYSLVDIVPAALFALGVPAPFGATGTIGLWTLTSALSWGIVALLFTCQKPNGSPFTFAKLGIGATLIFDTLTGPIASTFVWNMPFADALIGQVPFTAKHLLGMAAVSLLLAPLIFPSVNRRIGSLRYFFLKPSATVA